MEIMTILETNDVIQNVLILGGITVLGIITCSYLKGVYDRINGKGVNNRLNGDNNSDESHVGSEDDCGSECGSELTIKDGNKNETIKFNWVKVRDNEVQCVGDSIDKDVQTDLIGEDIDFLYTLKEYKDVSSKEVQTD
uniref:Uncharacterized protein n=1 Tax=Tricholoma saponaceum TaxID=113602 RepID=A0A6C0W3T8_9AGAR|nr:hypothetical protein [Tricholoma saponaceum]QIC20285.1 hypothetical protein [Tricholoma saponaceum]